MRRSVARTGSCGIWVRPRKDLRTGGFGTRPASEGVGSVQCLIHSTCFFSTLGTLGRRPGGKNRQNRPDQRNEQTASQQSCPDPRRQSFGRGQQHQRGSNMEHPRGNKKRHHGLTNHLFQGVHSVLPLIHNNNRPQLPFPPRLPMQPPIVLPRPIRGPSCGPGTTVTAGSGTGPAGGRKPRYWTAASEGQDGLLVPRATATHRCYAPLPPYQATRPRFNNLSRR